MFDVLIHSGTVIDPANGINGPADVGIKRGRIAAVEPALGNADAAERIDATDLLVTPGLIDLHTHVFPHGTTTGVDPDQLAWRTGVTTWVDAGSSGAGTFAGFAEFAARGARSRVLAFINLSYVGLVSPGTEFNVLDHADVALCARAARRFPYLVVGVKARIDRDTVGPHGVEPIRRARQAADELDLPLMFHISHGPPTVQDVLEALGPGDVLTHAFTGLSMRVLDDSKQPLPELLAARERGVLLDVGHGMGSLSFEVAERLIAEGILPDTISTDAYLHAVRSSMVDLPTCMSKFLALGMGLEDVVAATTVRPARVIERRDLGTLTVGAMADLALFALEDGHFPFYDSFHVQRAGTARLRNRLTIRAGVPLRAVVADSAWDDTPTAAWERVDEQIDGQLRAAATPPEAQQPEAFGPPEPHR